MVKETYYGFNRANPKHLQKLKHVLALQDEARWRAAADLYLFLNPKSYAWDESSGRMVISMDARTEARIIAAECAKLRKAYKDSGNEDAVSAGSLAKGDEQTSRRVYKLRMPATMLQFIQMIDPDLASTTRDSAGRAKWHRLTKEFREYAIGRS